VVELFDDGPDEEAQEEVTPRAKDASKLAEENVNGVWVVVNERVPGEHAADGLVCRVELIDISDFEGHLRVVRLGVSDEVGERSTPVAAKPRWTRWFVHWPGPQPASINGPVIVSAHVSTR
jgi:hypothetical protein